LGRFFGDRQWWASGGINRSIGRSGCRFGVGGHDGCAWPAQQGGQRVGCFFGQVLIQKWLASGVRSTFANLQGNVLSGAQQSQQAGEDVYSAGGVACILSAAWLGRLGLVAGRSA